MLYLLDANVLIDAARGFFQLDRIPHFWDWLIEKGESGRIAIPREIWEEFKDGHDLLAKWARSDPVKSHLVFGEEAEASVISAVVSKGYGDDLTDVEVDELGRDPFLIGYASKSPTNRCVVTTEISKPGKKRARRHIPDVCRDLGIRCIDTVGLINALDFRIGP